MRGLAATALLIACLAARAADGEIYRWTDASGTLRFSDRIEDVPPEAREDQEAALRERAPVNVMPELSAAPGGDPAAPAPGRSGTPTPAGVPDAAEGLLAGVPKLAAIGVAGLVALGLALAVVSFLFYAWVLQLACRICGEEPLVFARACAVTGVQILAGIAVGALQLGVLALLGFTGSDGAALQALQSAVGLGLYAGVLRWMEVCRSFLRALAVTLVTILVTAVISVAIAIGLALLFGLGSVVA